jgi:hypothetical protein
MEGHNISWCVWLFALELGIGHSGDLRPEYQVSGCLAALDIRAVYPGSISRRMSARQKTRAQFGTSTMDIAMYLAAQRFVWAATETIVSNSPDSSLPLRIPSCGGGVGNFGLPRSSSSLVLHRRLPPRGSPPRGALMADIYLPLPLISSLSTMCWNGQLNRGPAHLHPEIRPMAELHCRGPPVSLSERQTFRPSPMSFFSVSSFLLRLGKKGPGNPPHRSTIWCRD